MSNSNVVLLLLLKYFFFLLIKCNEPIKKGVTRIFHHQCETFKTQMYQIDEN
jgi:hypothetical protein